MSTFTSCGRGRGFVVGIVAMSALCFATVVNAQDEFVIDAVTGEVSSHQAVRFEKNSREHVTIRSLQTTYGRVANVTAEANIYLAPDNEPLTYSVFLNLNSSTGALFPGAMFADNMGLGNGYVPGVDEISSYSALFFRSSLDAQPGLADFHMELWNGDPFCVFDTPGNGFACAPIAGTEADFTDIPAATTFTATAVLPKGVTSPVQRVWMVVSGSETGVNPSPCRLGWDIAYGPAIIGDNIITGVAADDDIFMTQEDQNNGGDGAATCCDTGGVCDASVFCPGDSDGTRGFCWDGVAETPNAFTISTGPGTRCAIYQGDNVGQCANFTASISAPAVSTMSLVDAATGGSSVSIVKAPEDLALEIRFSSWDPDGVGTLLKAWQARIESAGYTSGFQGVLTPTTIGCTTDDDCKTVFGGVCSILGGGCLVDADCLLNPIETCKGSKCAFPVTGPNAGTQCEPGFIFTGRTDYVYYNTGGDLPAVDLSTINYRYASAVAAGPGVAPPDPFPAGGVYAGTLRLSATADCKGSFTVGFKPPLDSVLVDQNNEYIPLVGFIPATVTCEIRACCVDLSGPMAGCWENVTANQCAAGPGITFFHPDPTATCDDQFCIDFCFDDSLCQDGLACNGFETCDATNLCQPGTPPDCDDGVGCTDDSCVEDGQNMPFGTSHCENVPNDANCDDGANCNGIETCDVTLDCVTTGPVDCDDGDFCTVDTCIDPLGTCSSIFGCVPCCLPDGATCHSELLEDCIAIGGTRVSSCLGDGNGDGIDDACGGIVLPGTDCWRTACGGTKSSFCDTPIPADFFSAGSEPFDGVILLGGSGLGDSDTVLERLEGMALGNLGAEATISIELVALSLVSCEPIVVDMTGGGITEWNVSVGLSAGTPPERGQMSVTKTHENGGIFRAEFSVQPVFTFSRVDDASDIRILDTWQAGIPAIQLATVGDAPWVHRPAPGNTVFTCSTNFAPGVEEDPATGEQCCRKIGHAGPGHIHETAPPDCSGCPDGACCLPGGTCQVISPAGPQTAQEVCEIGLAGEYKGDTTDCSDDDSDGIPNVLESNDCCGVRNACNTGTNPNLADTDGDGCLDSEEIAGGSDPCDRCDYLATCVVLGPDCNGTLIPDECDIVAGTSEDCNGNDLPDECEDGGCCGTSVSSGTAACVFVSKATCDALVPPGTFLGPCEQCPPQSAGVAFHGSDLIIHTVGTPPDCPTGEKAVVACIPGAPKIDPWISLESDPGLPAICHNFGVAGEAIPAAFFGAGSDPFDSPVCLEGVAIGIDPFPEADTLIVRSVDPFNRCVLPSAIISTIDVTISVLNMVSVNPITVTSNGGQNPELWDVEVGLSDSPQATGSLSAVKTHCNGGFYAATFLPVQPKFIFTKVSDPAQVAVLDRADTGLAPVPFAMNDLFSPDAMPWVHDVDANLGVKIDVCSDFHPGIEDIAPVLSCDCNGNQVRDKCEIESGAKADCNGNSVPDECEVPVSSGGLCTTGCLPDCDGNGVPDICDPDCNDNDTPDACDIAAGTSDDCQPNGVPDECEQDCNATILGAINQTDACDIRDGNSLDCNLNGIPDECEPDCNENGIADSCDLASTSLDLDVDGIPDECACFSTISAAELIDDGGGLLVTSAKNRFLSFSVGGGVFSAKQAIRVTFVDLPGAFSVFNGTRMWVGPPSDVSVKPGEGFFDDPGVNDTFKAAPLQCDPLYRNWEPDGIIHVYQEYIIPGGRYIVETMDEGCAKNVASSYTSSLEFLNPKWADMVFLSGGEFVAPDGVTTVLDTLAILRAFAGLPDAPIKPRVDLMGVGLSGPEAPLDAKITVSDVLAVVIEFTTAEGYVFVPGNAPCP